MPLPFDPSDTAEPYLSLCADHPGSDVYPPTQFRSEWGPIFDAGRLDGTARVLVMGRTRRSTRPSCGASWSAKRGFACRACWRGWACCAATSSSTPSYTVCTAACRHAPGGRGRGRWSTTATGGCRRCWLLAGWKRCWPWARWPTRTAAMAGVARRAGPAGAGICSEQPSHAAGELLAQQQEQAWPAHCMDR